MNGIGKPSYLEHLADLFKGVATTSPNIDWDEYTPENDAPWSIIERIKLDGSEEGLSEREGSEAGSDSPEGSGTEPA